MGEWKAVGTDVWVRPYDFGGNPINTAVVDMGEGALLVLSPGTGVPESAFAELDAIGTVKALVSPGAFHHMGLPSWSERYPDAGLYGPKSAVAHIAKQHPTLKPLQDLDALRPQLSEGFVLEEMAGCKHPDVFLALTRDDALTWFTNEVLTNNTAYPGGAIGWAFWLTGNAPGLNVNSLAGMLIRAKKPLVRAYLESQIKAHPPTRLVPMHGAVIDDATLGDQIGEVLARRF